MGTGGETPLQGFLLLLSQEEQTEDAQLNLPEEYFLLVKYKGVSSLKL